MILKFLFTVGGTVLIIWIVRMISPSFVEGAAYGALGVLGTHFLGIVWEEFRDHMRRRNYR